MQQSAPHTDMVVSHRAEISSRFVVKSLIALAETSHAIVKQFHRAEAHSRLKTFHVIDHALRMSSYIPSLF